MHHITPVTIGILSDTHLHEPSEHFRQLVATCFAEASIILHAGDLTDYRILEVFADRQVHAVHGNMCRPPASHLLPRKKTITVNGFSIGIIHRTGYSYDFEDLLPGEFDPLPDCIVYGHTHRPVCHRTEPVLYINPGSFLPTGRHGAPGTYALLTIGTEMTARICRTPHLTDIQEKRS